MRGSNDGRSVGGQSVDGFRGKRDSFSGGQQLYGATDRLLQVVGSVRGGGFSLHADGAVFLH